MSDRHRPARALTVLAAVACLLAAACSADHRRFSETDWRVRVDAPDPALFRAPHAGKKGFFNPWLTAESRGIAQVLSWLLSPNPRYPAAAERHLPAYLPGAAARIAALAPDRDFALWIGHGSLLLRIGGRCWIVDPVFDKSVALLHRRQPPALTAGEIASLPGEKNIIITHNHYDHLELPAMKELPRDARVYAPLGLASFIKKTGRTDIVEMDWWQEHDAGGGFRVVCLPAQHWSRRVTGGINTSLWAGFLLITPRGGYFFAGDTGYFGGFREIGRTYRNIDMAFLPIGASQPRWFMHYAHMDPAEALRAAGDLGARRMVPVHWGTFALGEEPPGYPDLVLRKLAAASPDPARVRFAAIGEIMELD